MKKGYTTGVFDLFHIGHLNILKNAKENCDYLIVGVTTDEEAERLKGNKPIIPFEERIAIVKAIGYVDEVYEEHNSDKLIAWEELKFDCLFKGDDWKDNPKFDRYKREFDKRGVQIQFFPYTKGTSSTHLKRVLNQILKSKD